MGNNTIKNQNIQCPVCGYYCLGKGGYGCIDKPTLCGINLESNTEALPAQQNVSKPAYVRKRIIKAEKAYLVTLECGHKKTIYANNVYRTGLSLKRYMEVYKCNCRSC